MEGLGASAACPALLQRHQISVRLPGLGSAARLGNAAQLNATQQQTAVVRTLPQPAGPITSCAYLPMLLLLLPRLLLPLLRPVLP